MKLDIVGSQLKQTVVMADGEEANPGEYAIFATNGKGLGNIWPSGSVQLQTPNGVTTEITETYSQ